MIKIYDYLIYIRNPYEFDENEKVQCPHCKSELKVNKEYEIVLTTSKIR